MPDLIFCKFHEVSPCPQAFPLVNLSKLSVCHSKKSSKLCICWHFQQLMDATNNQKITDEGPKLFKRSKMAFFDDKGGINLIFIIYQGQVSIACEILFLWLFCIIFRKKNQIKNEGSRLFTRSNMGFSFCAVT